MLSFRPKGGILDSANDRDVSTSLRFARHDRTTFILSTYLPQQKTIDILVRSVPRLKKFAIGNLPPFIAKIDRNGHPSLWLSHSQLQRSR